MHEIDPIISQRDCKVKANVLDLLLYQSLKPKALPTFSLPIIRQWVEGMWHCYGLMFYIWFIFFILYIMACYQLPVRFITESRKLAQTLNQTNSNASNIAFSDLFWASRSVKFYVASVTFGVIMASFFEGYDAFITLLLIIMRLTRRFHYKIYNAPWAVILKLNVFRFVIITSIFSQVIAQMKLMMTSHVCSFNTAIAFVCGCYFFIFFLQGCDMTGYFGTIMHQVLFTDIISFGLVFGVILLAFGGTMTLVLFNQDHDIEGYSSLGTSVFTMFNYMQGFGVVPYFETIENKGIVIFIFVLFSCMTIILLLNMLIAAMSQTYASLAPYREHIWIRNTAGVIMMIQRRIMFSWITNRINKRVFRYNKR